MMLLSADDWQKHKDAVLMRLREHLDVSKS